MMPGVIRILLLCAGLASAGMTFSTESGKPVVSWGPVEGAWQYLELRAAATPFDSAACGKGAVVALIEPDGETGLFAENAQLSGTFVVDPSVCIGCGLCVSVCPVSAISLVEGKAVIDPAKCIACGLCASTCPVTAIFAPGSSSSFALVGISAESTRQLLEVLE